MEAEPIDTYLSSVQTAIEAVNSRADEIEKCKKTIEDLNSNGVTTTDSSGGITVEIPADATVTLS